MSNFLYALAAAWVIRRRYITSTPADVLSLVAVLLTAILLPWSMPAHVIVGLSLGAGGAVAVAHMLYCIVRAAPGSPDRARFNGVLMRAGALFLALVGIGVMLPTVASAVSAETYDRALAELDVRIFGVLPASVVAGWLAESPWLNFIVHLSYAGLMLLIGAGLVGGRVTAALLLSAALGYCCYLLVPACGPRFVMASWPAVDVSSIPLVVDTAYVRNCMPSLHLTAALLLAFNSGRLSAGWRWIVRANVPLTVLGTLGLGEHYGLDLVAAVPFSLLTWWLAGHLSLWLENNANGVLVRMKSRILPYTA